MARAHSNPRRRRTGDPEIDSLVPQILDQLPTGNRDLIGEALASVLRLGREDADRGDLKIVSGALREMRRSFGMFSDYHGVAKVSVYGSARTEPDDPNYKQASDFASLMADEGWMVITGGGPGIMAAANHGAGPESGFGLVIRLPFEEGVNESIVTDDKRLVFRYFFARKLAFVKEANAFAFFPGGFGTMDEAFETLTLTQTGKSVITPIVLLNAPGDDYWVRWEQFLRTQLLAGGMISGDDFSLFTVTDDAHEACAHIRRFYSNYRSERFVGEWLYLRMVEAPTPAQLKLLNTEFADIVKSGEIELAEPHRHEIEDDDSIGYERIRFRFVRKSYGRLRQLMDRLNDLD